MRTLKTIALSAALLVAGLPIATPAGTLSFGPAAAEAEPGFLKKAAAAYLGAKAAGACAKSERCRGKAGALARRGAEAFADSNAGRRAGQFVLKQLSRRGEGGSRASGSLLDRGSRAR